MPSLNMGSSYPLTEENVNTKIGENRIGNYAYGYLNDQGAFIVKYVGRSDSDLRTRIKHGIAEFRDNPKLKYEQFKFSYADTEEEAYMKECRNYHDFGGPDGLLENHIHPDSPDGYDWHCPICGQ